MHIKPPVLQAYQPGLYQSVRGEACEVSRALHRALEAQGVNKHLETAGILNSSLKSILNQEG